MRASHCVIFPGNGRCHVGFVTAQTADVREVPVPPDYSLAQLASALHDALSAAGHAGKNVCLALPSDRCPAASISTDGLPRQNRREAMLYRLEEKLPLAAEDLVADFVGYGTDALGVAVEAQAIQTLVDALEGEGVSITSITPAAFLAAQHKLLDEEAPACDALLWGCREEAELLLLRDAKPYAWYSLPLQIEPLKLHVGLHAARLAHPIRLCLSAVPKEIAERLATSPDVEVVASDERDLMTCAALASAAIEHGDRRPWIELRRDQLAIGDPYRQVRKPLSACVIATMLLLLSLCSVFLYRAWQYERIAKNESDRQLVIFRQALPGQAPPASVSSRLVSEDKKLRALVGQTSDLPTQQSALLVLSEALSRLPTDLRFRLLDMRFGEDRLYLDGQTRSHGDADAIAAALRKFKGFSIDPPKTEQLSDKAVAFTLAGNVVSERGGSGRR